MTEQHRTEVLIAGAGIGGLTAALALQARGVQVSVAEAAHRLSALGVGINLLPHAVAELDRLGLGSALARIAVAPHSIGFYDTDGALLFREPRGIEGGYTHPQLSVHRGRLQMLLLAAVRDRCGDGTVRTGTAVRGFRDGAGHISATTDTGTIDAQALIGADGVHSAIRAQLHPTGDPLRPAGVRMFRGLTATAPFLDGRTMAIIKSPDGVELVTYPVAADLVNWVLQVPRSHPEADDLLDHVDGWNPGWLDIAGLINGAHEVAEYPMADRDPLPWWGTGRVSLLGDAAHPMYPVGANGGSQAIVDAAALAEHLARHRADPEAGLRAYEAERRPATTDVVLANRAMHSGAYTRDIDQLASVAATYRHDTNADTPRGH